MNTNVSCMMRDLILYSALFYMLCSITSKKVCELKWGNIGIVEKAQETRFGMCPKYSRCSGIASWNHVLCCT